MVLHLFQLPRTSGVERIYLVLYSLIRRLIFLNLRRLEHKEVKEQKVHEPSENIVTKQEPTSRQSLRLASLSHTDVASSDSVA